jgi:hypothetical protein
MTNNELTTDELYIRFVGLLFGTLAAIIWLLSSLKADILPDFIKIQIPSLMGILAFAAFILIFATLIYDFIKRLLIRLIVPATAGVIYTLYKKYSDSSKWVKFSLTTASVIIIILILNSVVITGQGSIYLILLYIIMVFSKVASDYLVPNKK